MLLVHANVTHSTVKVDLKWPIYTGVPAHVVASVTDTDRQTDRQTHRQHMSDHVVMKGSAVYSDVWLNSGLHVFRQRD